MTTVSKRHNRRDKATTTTTTMPKNSAKKTKTNAHSVLILLLVGVSVLTTTNTSNNFCFGVYGFLPSITTTKTATTSRMAPQTVGVDGRSPWIVSAKTRTISSPSSSSTWQLQVASADTAKSSSSSSSSSSASTSLDNSLFKGSNSKPMGKIASTITKFAMMSYIIAMCLALPVALFPPFLLYKLSLIDKVRQEQLSLKAGQFCARWLLRIIPFCKLTTISSSANRDDPNPEPAIWVCNHTSALDVFLLLAGDLKLRGKHKRPIKIVYWKQLEDNPITKLLFQQCGFIPVQMAANKAGEDNDYDLKSFKALLKSSKKAFEEGFDIGILPEGQLNPNPEKGLLPCFPGAFTLAKMSRRPIHMMALHGTHRLWHARDDIGMTVTGRDVAIRAYPPNGRRFSTSEEFLETFKAVVGEFATKGKDLKNEELQAWLDGSEWERRKQQQQQDDGGKAQSET